MTEENKDPWRTLAMENHIYINKIPRTGRFIEWKMRRNPVTTLKQLHQDNENHRSMPIIYKLNMKVSC